MNFCKFTAACNIQQLITLNTFSRKSNSWKFPLEIPPKNFNFHQCHLKVFSRIFSVPFVDFILDTGLVPLFTRVNQVLAKRDAIELKMLEVFSKHGNFTLERVEKIENSQFYYFTNDLCYCDMEFTQHSICAIVSPPELYTDYEKMILPFDRETWSYLIIVFCSAFIGIFLINKFPRRYQDVVYGRGVKMPSFNVLGTLFGIGQTKLPENHFGRIILMAFIIFCLIFRTAYQGEV